MATNREEKIGFLRILAASMWADGQVSVKEMNFLKEMFHCFHLDWEDWKQLEPFLETPLTPEEAEALVKDYLETIRKSSGVGELRSRLEEMFLADGELSQDEKRWRDGLLEVLTARGPVDSVRGALRTWFKGGSARRSEVLKDFYDVDGFFKNRVLFRLKRKLKEKGMTPTLDEAQLERLCLLGGILAKVVYADGHLSPQERTSLRDILASHAQRTAEEVDVLQEVVEDHLCEGLDVYRLVTEYRDRVDYDGKMKLIDLIFQTATSDHVVSKVEEAQIEKIVALLRIPRSEFINVRSKYWKKFERNLDKDKVPGA